MKTKNVVIPAVCAVAGVAAGFVGGFFFAKAKYKKVYEEKYEKDIYQLKKKEAKATASEEPHDTTEDEAKKIAEGFPSELWTEQFKKDQEKRKEYKNLVRKEQYILDDDDNDVDKSEVFDNDKFEKKNYSRCKQEFEDKLDTFSEYSGISKAALMQGSVRIISDDDYYASTHDAEPTELQWDSVSCVLNDIDGNILEPEITFGEDWNDILRRIESRGGEDTWVYDERLEEYYCVSLKNARDIS